MPATNIKNLSVQQLLAMRSDIDRLLQSKKSEVQAQLAQIGGDGVTARRAGSIKGHKGGAKDRRNLERQGRHRRLAGAGNQGRQEERRFSDRKAGQATRSGEEIIRIFRTEVTPCGREAGQGAFA